MKSLELGEKVRPLLYELKSLAEGLPLKPSSRRMKRKVFEHHVDFLDELDVAEYLRSFFFS